MGVSAGRRPSESLLLGRDGLERVRPAFKASPLVRTFSSDQGQEALGRMYEGNERATKRGCEREGILTCSAFGDTLEVVTLSLYMCTVVYI
jgi:hypothetical protein